MVKFILENLIEELETKLDSKATLDTKFKNTYNFGSVDEIKLLEAGFEFKEYSSDNMPIYTFNNLMAYYDHNQLNICEITTCMFN